MHPAVHSTAVKVRPLAEQDVVPGPVDLSFAGPADFHHRSPGAINRVDVSPITNAHLANEQEMQSGADELSGVHGSSLSGGDYSHEQGAGRAPGWEWPWNQLSGGFDLTSLDKWNPERQGLGLADPLSGINPFVGVAEPAYSPIAAIDQLTMHYENDPDQWQFAGPGPITIPEAGATPYTEISVLG